MIAHQRSDEFAPLTWFGRVPVYASGVLVMAHTATMILVALAGVLGIQEVVSACVFSSEAVLNRFQFWQIGTYAFVDGPSFWFLIQMAMLWFFGGEVEKFLGRRAFLFAYGMLILIPPLLLTIAGVFGYQTVFAGSGPLHFAVFICFVAINPGAQIFFGIAAKWIALALLGINSLMLISGNAWTEFSILWIECLSALGFMYYCGVRSMRALLPEPRLPRLPRRAARSQPRPVRQRSKRREESSDPLESIDPILEKIARTGIASLTPKERKLLEKAREDLLHRDGKG